MQQSTFISCAADEGGAVYLRSSDLTDQGSTFSGNRALVGGAIRMFGRHTTAALVGTKALSNTAKQGGAIAMDPTASAISLSGATLDQNTASVSGGALYMFEEAHLADEAHREVEAAGPLAPLPTNEAGGAASLSAAGAPDPPQYPTVTILATTFMANTAETGLGGALCLRGPYTATIRQSLFINNQAPRGAGIAALGVPELWVLGSTLQANQASLYPAGAAIDFRGMGADSSRVDLIETTISRNHGEGLFLSGSGRTGTSAWLWGSQMQMNFLDLNRTLAAANVDCGDLAALNIDNATAFEPSGMSGPAQWVLCRSTCLPAQPGRCNIRKPEPWAVTSSGIAPDEQRQNLLIRNVTVDVLYLLPVEEGFLPRCRWTAAPLVPVVETSALVVGPTRIACEPTSYPRFTDHLTLEVSSEGYTWSEPVNFLFDWPNPTMGMLPLILGISIPVGLFFLGMIVFVWWFRVRRAKRTEYTALPAEPKTATV
eukprot:GAFH01000809.1.p1 GENE.GAFH01000809.1~~GAFH01000809.1.p1  ORF type:complete len:486 (-),score=157.78 GAFH01000809.1:4-1461(-)